ncbi:MAG: hypothetical protein M1605_02560 [Candidatus Thermoplasmatota archaeon]|nr:hypothetical protein [Candidatus Thermoplasmatota archaeon]
MEREQKGSQPSTLKMLLNQPVSAVKSSIKITELMSNIDKIKAEISTNSAKIDSLLDRILSEIREYAKDETLKDFQEIQQKITDFLKTIFEQFKKKKSEDTGKRLTEEETSLQLERDALLKAIESFLISGPDIFDFSRLSLSWKDGHYESKVVFKAKVSRSSCNDSLQGLWDIVGRDDVSVSYEFSLKTAGVENFSGLLHISDIKKGIRIPINSAVGWASKEAVINYEKLDKYYLSSAEIGDSSSTFTFLQEDSSAYAVVSYSDYGGSPVLGVHYKDENQDTDILANSVLANNLDEESIKDLAKILNERVRLLLGYKNRLTSLVVNETDIISTLDALTFFRASAVIYHCRHTEDLKNIPEDLSRDYIRERMQIFGKEAETLNRLLGLE